MKIIIVFYKILWGLNAHEVPKTEEYMIAVIVTTVDREPAKSEN